ncbi:hypothetical protein [Nonomuraea gerenzanensis]|uniref:GerMN domain-containing protein n=1 Tax=Nonomuraea gerenzanensis TaxID=93944 RepID=A0A1M4EPW1_9ACTN|nr:hypothetical protein [Nonomuraea gerenzanensis]UBU12352.1 hypothetical protein LCN96_50100 [Nonomuraea gerenzanensis]SBP00896.1 hypothetical protein BN4615_P10412 [Nonomuraea gerenzanensis]
MKALTSVAALLLALLTGLTAACGISPTDVQDRGDAPTVKIPPPTKTIYLLRDGALAREPADVEDDTVDSVLNALFDASSLPLGDRDTALRGFTYLRTRNSINPPQRDEIQLPRTSTLTVYISGDGTLTKLGKAQIVCTAQQDAAFEVVKIVRENEGRPPQDEGRHTCGELK